MSFSPSLSMVRLQELKLWQGSYENLIQKSKPKSKTQELDYLEGVSVLDSSNENAVMSGDDEIHCKNWDKKAISPSKPFEQLLEEKLAQENPVVVSDKPKRPFLRKGQGLARFRMGGVPPLNKKRDFPVRKSSGYQKTTPQNQFTPRKGILKKSVPLYHEYVDLSPLTVPDFVKPRGTWKSVFEEGEKEIQQENVESGAPEMLENYEEFRKSLGSEDNLAQRTDVVEKRNELFGKTESEQAVDTPSGECDNQGEIPTPSRPDFEQINKEILEKIYENAHKYFLPTKTFMSNNIPDHISDIATLHLKNGLGDLSLEEQKMENELRIFEALEKKVENSSFCSTNTSVANLLASTPRKFNVVNKNNSREKGNSCNFEIPESIEFTNDMRDNIQLKLAEVAQKTDVLQQFLMNLRKMEHKATQDENSSLHSEETKKSEQSTSTNTSYSEENTRWSSRSPSITDQCTEVDTTCLSDSWKKIDVGVNTTFDYSGLDETIKKTEPCQECEKLRAKFSENKRKLGDVQLENSTLKTQMRVLENEYDQLKKDLKKKKEESQEKVEYLQEELEKERKKYAKEKSYFETYIKEAQNRPSKKEREEITQLKQDLADAKELLKMRDAKNGSTQARLRNQIKQHEKEIADLKITVEKLQRDNAKLNASQKYVRRPQEVKMLHEINKNLSKLTEETLRKQLNKSGNGNPEQNQEKEKKHTKDFNGECTNKENEKSRLNASNKEVQKNVAYSKDSVKMDSAALDLTQSEALTIEKQYESVFGNFTSPRNSNVSTNYEKSEKTLPDGSIEINYSNGNVKTVSADGQLIKIKYFNGDFKETNLKEKIIRYHYATADSWHIQYPDGTEVMEYKDGQKCKKYTDGKTEVSYPDGTLRIINPDGSEEQQFPDGRKTMRNVQGEQIILLPNGQREIHTKEFKRREYPDGTVRTLHKDGSVETIYANGRVRLKDSNGVLVMDTHRSEHS